VVPPSAAALAGSRALGEECFCWASRTRTPGAPHCRFAFCGGATRLARA
jgi:hypothetical protein